MAPTTRVFVMLGALLVAALAAPAAGHVTINPKKAATEGYMVFKMRLPHDCGDATIGTSNLTVTLPQGVIAVKQEQVAGWKAVHTMRKIDPPIQSGSRMYSETMDTATWVGFLPDGLYREFGLSLKMLPQKNGTIMYFKSSQDCHGGFPPRNWDMIPSPPGNMTRLLSPAPAVTLIEGYEA